MKKLISYVSIALFSFAASAHAEQKKVECSTQPAFESNKCEVCYEDTYRAKETPTGGWSSALTEVVIPWEHATTGELDEIIYDTEQKRPEIKSTLTVTTKPEKPEDLWENHETLIWKPFDDHKEFVIKKGEKVGLYRIAQDASIAIEGKNATDSVMFITPLTVGNFNPETNEETEPKVRNICVRGTFIVDKPTVVESNTPPVPAPEETVTPEEKPAVPENVEPEAVDTAEAIESTLEEEVPEELNAAEPEPVVTATPEQSETQAGPEIWIFLAFAFVFATGWNAWQKQRN